MRDTWVLAVIMATSVPLASAHGQGMDYVTSGNADSVFAKVRARLTHLKYHEDAVDVPNRWMLVEPPGQKTKVDIRVEAMRDSATVKIQPLGTKDMIAQLQVLVLVTHDAALDPEKTGAAAAAPTNGELPPSQWRPELFLSPLGRLWIARSGLFTTDSLFGGWRLSFGQSVSIGTRMAFVDEDTLLLGLHDQPSLYRSTDAGKSWSKVPTGRIDHVDALESVGGSIWGFATYFDHDDRRTAFLRSADGGGCRSRPRAIKRSTMFPVTGSVSNASPPSDRGLSCASTARCSSRAPTAYGGGRWPIFRTSPRTGNAISCSR